MRWQRQVPKAGDIRNRRVFAWTPTRVGDETVWLEAYAVEEVYHECRGGGFWAERRRRVAP